MNNVACVLSNYVCSSYLVLLACLFVDQTSVLQQSLKLFTLDLPSSCLFLFYFRFLACQKILRGWQMKGRVGGAIPMRCMYDMIFGRYNPAFLCLILCLLSHEAGVSLSFIPFYAVLYRLHLFLSVERMCVCVAVNVCVEPFFFLCV